VANSIRTKTDLITLLGVSEEKISCIYFGANTQIKQDCKHDAPRKRTLLFIGALGWDGRKGLDIALRALAILAGRPNFEHQLVVAGAGVASPWRALAEKLKISHRVQFVSFVANVPALMEQADLLISPSRYESYGLALQEAVCAGLPPIVLAGRSGFMERLGPYAEDFSIDSEEPAQWAGRIEAALANLKTMRSRVNAARKQVLTRTWSDFAREFMSLGEGLTTSQSSG
jgi:glycosyltransferase involved in cell wall biosynthesis